MMARDGAPAEQTLERELRAMRPRIEPEFAAKLDAWAADGFPSEGEAPAPAGRGRRPRLSPALPRLAFAASLVLIVGTVSLAVLGTSGDGPGGLDSEQPGLEVGPAGSASPPADSAPSATGAAPSATGATPSAGEVQGAGAQRQSEQVDSGVIAPEPTVPLPPSDEKLRPGAEREVAHDASMTLSTEPSEVDEVADGVIEVTERYDGIVLRSDVSTEAERARAGFDLRIPAQNLEATLADLSDLASVSERDESSVDVTAPFVSAEERFDDAKAEVDALLERLGEATSAGEIARLREQLASARTRLAIARSDLAALKQRTDFSRLAVTVTGDGDSDGWSLGDAADDAGSVLEDLAGAGLVALAAIVPLGLLAAALWLGVNAVRRRARERALDD